MMNLSSYVCTMHSRAREKARVEMPNGHDFFSPLVCIRALLYPINTSSFSMAAVGVFNQFLIAGGSTTL